MTEMKEESFDKLKERLFRLRQSLEIEEIKRKEARVRGYVETVRLNLEFEKLASKKNTEQKEKERIAYEVERQRLQMIRDLEDPQSELFDPLRASKIKKGEVNSV